MGYQEAALLLWTDKYLNYISRYDPVPFPRGTYFMSVEEAREVRIFFNNMYEILREIARKKIEKHRVSINRNTSPPFVFRKYFKFCPMDDPRDGYKMTVSARFETYGFNNVNVPFVSVSIYAIFKDCRIDSGSLAFYSKTISLYD